MQKSLGNGMKICMTSSNNDQNIHFIHIFCRNSNVRNALNAKIAFLYSTPIAKSIRKGNPVERIAATIQVVVFQRVKVFKKSGV